MVKLCAWDVIVRRLSEKMTVVGRYGVVQIYPA